MKAYAVTSFLSVLIILFGGCTTKTYEYINHISFPGMTRQKTPDIRDKTLHEIANRIKQTTNASLQITGTLAQDTPEGINLYLTDKYLKISFTLTRMFGHTTSNLNEETTQYMKKIMPILQKYPDIIIQVVGHAYDEGTAKEMQHYADLRAISVAELFFGSGLKQEILAKGCSNLIPRKECPSGKPHLLCSAQNRRVDLFIYTNKDNVITKCR